jgi:glycosyltransferase involved in cell wall biosynthesis
MKIAVIDHVGNYGGGSRFIRNLLPSLKKRFSDLQITFFGNSQGTDRESFRPILKKSGIEFKPLAALQLQNLVSHRMPLFAKAIRLAQMKQSKTMSLLPILLSGNIKKELEKIIKGFDVAYFGWPYFLDYPELDCPVVATFHDFNFKYFFGSRIFDDAQLELLERQVPVWLANATPIVSSHFMKSEIQKFYPACASKVKVIHLAPLCGDQRIERQLAQKMVTALGVPQPYIIYPTNLCSHKNIGPLIVAVHYLWRNGFQLTLALTGPGTKTISGHASPIGIENGLEPTNILGLGYVTDEQMNALITCASVVVTPSLYEAGNGPGIDAWALGVPVAMSDIPCFTEHIHHQRVHAELFDPRNPQDISTKIQNIIKNPRQSEELAKRSQEAVAQITWSSVAEKYLNIFISTSKEKAV